MKKVLFLTSILLFAIVIYAQDCDKARPYRLRAEGMREEMKNNPTPNDMQLVANEYEIAAQYAPYCPDIYYNLGLCYEALGERQPELRDRAITNYRKYLQLNPTAANKHEVDSMIYKIEEKNEMDLRQQEKEWGKFLGKWKCRFVRDNDDTWRWKEYDLEIFIFQRKLYAKVASIYGKYSTDNGFDHLLPGTLILDYQTIPVEVKDNYISWDFYAEQRHFYGKKQIEKYALYRHTGKFEIIAQLVSANRMERINYANASQTQIYWEKQ